MYLSIPSLGVAYLGTGISHFITWKAKRAGMADIPSSYVIRNCLLFAYRALRHTERLFEDSLRSPYEAFFADIASALSPGKKIEYTVPNSEVEKFYTRRLSENDFLANVQTKILSKVPACGPGTVVGTGSNPVSTVVNTFNQFSLLFTVVWEMLSTANSLVCNKLPKLSGKQIWEVFLKLDTGESKIYYAYAVWVGTYCMHAIHVPPYNSVRGHSSCVCACAARTVCCSISCSRV